MPLQAHTSEGAKSPPEPPLLGRGVVVAQEHEVVAVHDGVGGDGAEERTGEDEDRAEAEAPTRLAQATHTQRLEPLT